MENDKASSSSDGPGELQCIGTLEIVSPKPVGFLCGSIPVPTDKSFHAFNSAIVPSTQTLRAPRYQMIPTETDLNMPPFLPNIPEKVLPIAVPQSRSGGGLPYESGSIASNLSRKGEALAVSGLAEYGDEIDVIAPADILKQIFKIPYSRARLSIAVHRIGQTLVLNAGPDVEEGEKLIRRHNQSQCADKSLFLNFAMHSVRMEACDCPTAHNATSDEQSNSSVLPGRFESREMSFESSEHPEYPQVKRDSFVWRSKKDKRNKGHDAIKKVSQVKEKPRSSVQESEKYRRVSNDGFLRVLFWQFHKFRVLLGSDLLIFSNEKYVSVSLHLWDVSRQVTPLTWLEAWLDNVMASVPELAICYHQDGVVQGYELLKTNEIFLSKGISEDGNPAFNPHVVQQNGLSVLRFLEENCKQDPGAYWLYKSAGEDVIQLFDMSVLPKNHSSSDGDDSSNSVPSLVHRGRSDSLLSLGTLLYRIAHRLSLSMAPNNRARCARFFKKCLDFLDEPDHLVVRASAHEQFARFLLTYGEELDLTSEVLPLESEATVADVEDESFVIFTGSSDSIVHQLIYSLPSEDEPSKDEETYQDSVSEVFRTSIESGERDERDSSDVGVEPCSSDQSLAVCEMTPVVQTIVDPIASKLAAIRHISQAIKSLRWKRQLQSTEPELEHAGKTQDRQPVPMDFSVCACGDADCIEICDIWEWLPTSKLDDKLWKLVLLLGESYLALGQAYKDSDQLHQTLKVVELASLVYGSMPQHLKDTRFISSMACNASSEMEVNLDVDCLTLDQFSSTYLFWAKAWTLVGDVYVEFHMIKGKEIPIQTEKKPFCRELRMSSSVLKEVERLKKKLGPFNQNCNSCSLVNCSCQSDRASSGSSASSSGDIHPLGYSRKHSKKSYAKSISRIENHEDVLVHHKEEDGNGSESLEMETHDAVFTEAENDSREKKVKNGGIFKYIQGPVIGDVDYNLSAALSCYEEARKALGGYPTGSTELQSVVKKKGWVWNEVGRIALERKELDKAELAFVEAVKSFKEVSDHVNIILINCNLGHGRRAVAEEMVSKMESLKKHAIFHNSYNKALETAKLEYGESLRYYGAARTELNSIAEEEPESISSSLRNEAFTQFAHTYLRLGMLLARENATAEVYGVVEDCTSPGIRGAKKGLRKHEISANDAIREALSVYESLGELRKQEAAYAYFQLACYQRDCCLKFLESDQKKNSTSKGENSVFQRVKQYASLADRNWQKSMDFYGPKTHPVMYLTILIERSALSVILSSSFHSIAMLESALPLLLEGRHVSEETIPDPLMNDDSKIYDKFWTHLQTLLKRMLAATISTNTNKSLDGSQQTPSNKSGDVGKLKELYRIALKSTPDFSQLHALHSLWIS